MRFNPSVLLYAGEDPTWTAGCKIQELWNRLMASEKITEEELVTRIRGEISDSLGYMGMIPYLHQREEGMQYYYGLPFGNEVEGRSQFVDSTVQIQLNG